MSDYGLSYRDKLIKSLGYLMLMSVTIIGIMLASGWQIKFTQPKYCEGQKTVRVGDASSFWEIAQREFPESDPRGVTDKLIELNGTTTLNQATIQAPIKCDH